MDVAPDVADPILVNDVLQQLKSEGTFDQFRRDCLGDVDTKPAYQNLRQRVESYVSNFLSGVTWSPTMNKNHLRDSLRRQINQSEILAIGVERVIEQVVDPQIQHVFRPKLEEVLQGILKVDLDPSSEVAPPRSIAASTSNLLPPFTNQGPTDSHQSTFVSQAPPFTGHVSVSTPPPPIMVSASSLATPPPLPYEAPPLPSNSPPPLPDEAPPPPLPDSIAPPLPPDEPPAPGTQDMDIDIEIPETLKVEQSESEEPRKAESFKFMKNLLHKATEKLKSLVGEKKEENQTETTKEKQLHNLVVEEVKDIKQLHNLVVEEVKDIEGKIEDRTDGDLELKEEFEDKDDVCEDQLTDITVSSVHTSDLSSFTEGISSSSSSSDLSDSEADLDDGLKKVGGDVEIEEDRSSSRSSSTATDLDKGSSKGSAKKSSNLALAISRYHSDSDEDVEKRQERRRKAAVAREERAALRQQAREEHQKKIEQMKAERLVKKRRKALQDKSSTSDEEESEDKPERRDKRTRSIQLKEQMKEKLLEKKKEKKRMAYASLSDETLSPRKNVKSKETQVHRLDLVARKLRKPLVKFHQLLCEELTGEEQTIASNKNFRAPEFKKMLAKKEKAKRKLEKQLIRMSEDDNDDQVVEEQMDVIVDSKNEQVNVSNVQATIYTVCEPEKENVKGELKIPDVASTSSYSLKDSSFGEIDSQTTADTTVVSNIKDTIQKSADNISTEIHKDRIQEGLNVEIASKETDCIEVPETEINKQQSDIAITEKTSMDDNQTNVGISTDNLKEKSKNIDDFVVDESIVKEMPQTSEVSVTDIKALEVPMNICGVVESTPIDVKEGEYVATEGNSMEKESPKVDVITDHDSNVDSLNTDEESHTSCLDKIEDGNQSDVQKEQTITPEDSTHLHVDEDMPSNIELQEFEKDDASVENPPTPTQDEPLALEEIAEVEPAAIPIYSLSPVAYQGPKIGSLFKVIKDTEVSAGPEESSASSPLSAISSGDLSADEGEKVLEEEEPDDEPDDEPDEEGEIKEGAESVTEEKPSEELKTGGRYGMRCRRKIHSPRYSNDEYLLYGFKKTRSSGSTEDKTGKEAKSSTKTKDRTTRKSTRTESSAAKEEGEVDEQPEPKKRRKAATEDNSSIMSGRRQRQVPRRYSPSESVTGRRAQSPTSTGHTSSRYIEQAYSERKTKKLSSPPPPQRETGRNRKGSTPPRRGLRRPSGDRSESQQQGKRRR
ncbi:uncharacterized protein [Antedon mediterranea]|uniref:uncharacterized protein n=1 Tax=Antedon mediterranea TaxID=105859 RepID=UPI003AF88A12